MTTANAKSTIDTVAGECIAVRMQMLSRIVTNISCASALECFPWVFRFGLSQSLQNDIHRIAGKF